MKTFRNYSPPFTDFPMRNRRLEWLVSIFTIALIAGLMARTAFALDTFVPGSNPDGHVKYHAQVTPYFCGAASMEMQLDCNAVRNNNPLINMMLNGPDGAPVPMGAPPPPITFVGNQVVAGGQTYIYGLVHGLNTFNGIYYLNLFWPPGAGTDALALQSGMNLMDSPLVGGPGQHNYVSYNLAAGNGARASRTIASAIAQFQVAAIVGVHSGAHWISVVGVDTDVAPAPNQPYTINGFYVNDPWDGWVQANPFVINPRTGQPARDRNGNLIPQTPGLHENEWISYRGDLRADGTRRQSEWFKLFNPSPVQPGVPFPLGAFGYKFEVEPVGPEPVDSSAFDSIPPNPPELSGPLTAAQALVYATNGLAAKPYMAGQPGFHNGNWDVANAMLVKYSDDEAGDGDWVIPYEGSGGTNDVTGAVLVDAMTGALDEVLWMNPGDVVSSMTLAELDTMEMDEYAGIGPNDNEGEPQLSVQPMPSGLTNSLAITWPVSTSFSYFVQQTPSLTPPVVWTDITNDPIVVSNEYQLVIPVQKTGNMFFRLATPTSTNSTSVSNLTATIPGMTTPGFQPPK